MIYGLSLQYSQLGAVERCSKGLGAESGEKREPASDIDTGAVDGLKALNN